MKKLDLKENQKAWVTSDIHLYHKAVMSFCPDTRKRWSVTDVNEMTENIILDWNDEIDDDDLVFILGDVSFGSTTATAEALSRMNGKKILIIGNHDAKYLDKKLFTVWFDEMHHYLEVEYNKKKIVMCHFPIAEWNACHWGSIHLHGHLHGNENGVVPQLHKFKCFDVGIDATGRIAVPLDEVLQWAESRPNMKHGDGQQGI